MLALLLSTPAFSQAPGDWILDTVNPVLEPDLSGAHPWMENSVSAPTVVYDPLRDRFIMVFETRILDPIDGAAVGCPQGLWGLGLAESPDGVTWTVSSSPLVEPVPGSGTYFSCVAAHPSAVFETPPANGSIIIWFKSEQDTAAQATCGTAAEPAWGCDQYTGVGRMRITLNAQGNIVNINVRNDPVLTTAVFPSIGYPKVFKTAGTYRMLLTLYPDIWSTTSATPDAFVVPTPVMEVADYQGAVTWVRDEFFNATGLCDDTITFPLASFPGGRDTNQSAVLSGGWGKAISTTGSSWVLGVDPQQEWADDNSFRHWEILRLVTGEYLIWFDQSDPGSNPRVNRIYFGGTTQTFNNTDVQSKICP
jgi:hypothetical protein